jgi:2-octaprenyl-6-methoxyphenol hydroxylase
MRDERSIAVIGGGLAGTVLAAVLADQGWPVQVFEAQVLTDAPAPERDLRTLALAGSSWHTLARLGITPAAVEAVPIRHIHVSWRGRPGSVLLDAADSAVDSFGHTVSYGRLLQAVRAAAGRRSTIEWEEGCQVEQVDGSSSAARLCWRDRDGAARSRLAPLAIIADGGALPARASGLNWHYRQQAIACRVETDRPTGDLAWERFTIEGPIALLPSTPGYALIWTGQSARIDALLAADDPAFLAALQDWFGDRAGRFLRCSRRLRYPLAAHFELRPARQRVVRVANAAQTLHPVAGQGFNLGLRDVAALLAVLEGAPTGDPGSPALLARYLASRTPDRQLTSVMTHALAGVFTLPLPGLGIGATLGFAALDNHPTLRRRFARWMADGVHA